MSNASPAIGRTAAYDPAHAIVPPSPQELTGRLPNLEVTELLGHGGMGVVYKGRQPFLDRQVAIKLIRPDFGMDAEAQRRFWRCPLAVGQMLPKIPLPLSVENTVVVDLEATYSAAAADAYLE